MKFLYFLTIFAFQACNAQQMSWAAMMRWVRNSFPTVQQMSTAELSVKIERRTTVLLLDARQPDEFAVSHLKNAQNINPDATTFPMLASVSKDTEIVVYCSVGYRSSALATRLLAAGFTNVKNLEGSIFKWANEGRPVFSGNRQVQRVHPFDATWGRLLNRRLRSQ
jgi:rhodanese-related sulfurtransferase